MALWHHPLSDNDVRQCLRIATGATVGFTVCKFFDCSFGVFFTVTPMLLLGLVPVMNGRAARQLLASAVISGLEVGVLGGLLGAHPGLMTPLVFVLFTYKFACMSKGRFFLFGANSVLSLSIMLHFASYPDLPLNTLVFGNLGANILSVLIAYLVTWLIPDVTERQPPAMPAGGKQTHRMRHEALMGASLATISFVVFQLFDLRDSISAQATTVLLLFPMHWNGTLSYARKRAVGTVLGVAYGVACQAILYDWFGVLILVAPLLWIGTLLFAKAHVKEASGSGVGFGAMATLGILFGQYLSPSQDFMYDALYRVSSNIVAIVITLMLCFALHKLLNYFPATRFGTA
ncbi:MULTISPECIES: DUF2955 domain-containing protein [unclassified Salinivibrio]|uniref:DUF2955 domain-containing protein n=1 Tax=unclassified Salinivibrio TaxID=2636825 RepID=UPI00098704D2|nr:MULTISPECIES: DUF2955 domain-containing protein [unclassified Salinivibrio]OOF10704.1 1,4-alpha-glucan branching protein [Salinivibrio sp. PR919]OOF14882.1 1,4-alpha-glucan branching protein [Salinivibrio sp. PR932]